jgi:hypothetical protein
LVRRNNGNGASVNCASSLSLSPNYNYGKVGGSRYQALRVCSVFLSLLYLMFSSSSYTTDGGNGTRGHERFHPDRRRPCFFFIFFFPGLRGLARETCLWSFRWKRVFGRNQVYQGKAGQTARQRRRNQSWGVEKVLSIRSLSSRILFYIFLKLSSINFWDPPSLARFGLLLFPLAAKAFFPYGIINWGFPSSRDWEILYTPLFPRSPNVCSTKLYTCVVIEFSALSACLLPFFVIIALV